MLKKIIFTRVGRIFLLLGMVVFLMAAENKPKNDKTIVSAFVRIKNEIKTIEASLNSIKGIFDKIVIIHSNELDDGTNELARQWCAKVKGCEIHEYPHAVIPAHHASYRKKVQPENTLAAYYNFGLTFFGPEEWVVKIDADQIYITSQLKKSIDFLRQNADENKSYGIKGYNTYPYRGRLVKYKLGPHNGGTDSFLIKRKYMGDFKQKEQYEKLTKTSDIKGYKILPGFHWFHYMKQLKSAGVIRENDTAKPNEILPLTPQEVQLYRTNILPLLLESESPYMDLILE